MSSPNVLPKASWVRLSSPHTCPLHAFTFSSPASCQLATRPTLLKHHAPEVSLHNSGRLKGITGKGSLQAEPFLACYVNFPLNPTQWFSTSFPLLCCPRAIITSETFLILLIRVGKGDPWKMKARDFTLVPTMPGQLPATDYDLAQPAPKWTALL